MNETVYVLTRTGELLDPSTAPQAALMTFTTANMLDAWLLVGAATPEEARRVGRAWWTDTPSGNMRCKAERIRRILATINARADAPWALPVWLAATYPPRLVFRSAMLR